MLIEKADILKYIPQRAPFVMIDELISANTELFTSTFVIQEENPMVEENIFSENGVLEHIAQTCAAGFGYLGSQEGKKGSLGFIGAISKVEVSNLFQVGEKIETRVKVLNQFENIFLIEGIATCNSLELVKCQMKIVQG